MQLLSLVHDFDIITIFRHQIADHDALGSQFALKEYLQTIYPDKKIYALGNSVGACAKLFPQIDECSDEEVKNSIAIVLDSANTNRVDDERFKTAKCVVKIDHHIVVEEYGDYALVDIKAAATCEILTFLFKEMGNKITPLCAKYLYYGLTADSLNFTTTNTTSNTLLAGAYLVECGVNPSEVRRDTSGMSRKEFEYLNYIRSHVQVHGKVAYTIIDRDVYEKFGLSYTQAKEKVFALADVDDFEVWCLFSEDEVKTEKVYNGSLRSKLVPINKVANLYGGGGHKNACGVKNLTFDKIKELVNDLNQECM